MRHYSSVQQNINIFSASTTNVITENVLRCQDLCEYLLQQVKQYDYQ